mmetsp:Transcript_11773/g.32656  ORF Transcript_11773/g.32656 Transcript_11773/m.32656 type:complete len:217 (+) Transcript_11773:124-774(+)
MWLTPAAPVCKNSSMNRDRVTGTCLLPTFALHTGIARRGPSVYSAIAKFWTESSTTSTFRTKGKCKSTTSTALTNARRSHRAAVPVSEALNTRCPKTETESTDNECAAKDSTHSLIRTSQIVMAPSDRPLAICETSWCLSKATAVTPTFPCSNRLVARSATMSHRRTTPSPEPVHTLRCGASNSMQVARGEALEANSTSRWCKGRMSSSNTKSFPL